MARKKVKSVFFVIAVFIVTQTSCRSPFFHDNWRLSLKDVQEYALSQLRKSLGEVPAGQFPIRTKGLGAWELTPPSAWTSGFYPGCLWLACQLSGDSFWIDRAKEKTGELKSQQYNRDSHDIGFMMLSSYGNGYTITQDEEYERIILQAANSLATRYNKKTECIQSWNGEFQVIIDNMMNLEILFWAARHGGSRDLYEIAVNHANKTIENHLREDGSSFHVVVYDTASGKVKEKRTAQGLSAGSAWARGQAWGIYGFTSCYRETGDTAYLNTAIKMADYFADHLPPDCVPFWDLNLPPDSPEKYRDASAAAIALSGLLELRTYVEDHSRYDKVINNILESLVNRYLSTGTKSSGILLHCAYNVNSQNPYDCDASTIWGDYYFLEALKRVQDGSTVPVLKAPRKIPEK
jgi:unsaturated chondroitin disaccharide hydrolase